MKLAKPTPLGPLVSFGTIFLITVACAADDKASQPQPQAEATIEQRAAKRVVQIVAHRGASAERPECTLAATRRAIEVGATAVEVDVRTSRDGRLFILHDATLDRTTNSKGAANALTLAQLQKLNAGSHFDSKYRSETIPSLVETAALCRGKIDLLLDLKEQGDEYDKQVAAVIREHGDPAKTIVGVRSVDQARRFRKLLPDSKQLALIPSVADIEKFADAGADFIRLWPRWLEKGDKPVRQVRATGKRLHLNGVTGDLNETLQLLRYSPDSLSSDDPNRQKATLSRIAAGDGPSQQILKLIEKPKTGAIITPGECRVGARTFLNRNYEMLEAPKELAGLPRFSFAGGCGRGVHFQFRKPAVVFAVFDYNKTGLWSFEDWQQAKEHGWHLWRANGYRGSSNPSLNDKPNRASIWFREFKKGEALPELPAWWLCLAVVDVDTAREIEGFKEGLVSRAKMDRYSHPRAAAQTRPLDVPALDSADEYRKWRGERRQQFVDRMLYSYDGRIEFVEGDVVKNDSFEQQEFHVTLDGKRLFRYFRLEPIPRPKADRLPAVVCFMGHGKVAQILEEDESYQHACAANFARAGYLVFAMENIGMEPGRDTHHDLDQSLRLEGHGWYSLLFAHQRLLLDRVFSDSRVDVKRVGATGVSTGGLLALSAAAMEPRIAAASIQGIFGSMRVSFIHDRSRHCKCGAIPGLLPHFDLPELALLVAPRALHISNGASDGFSPFEARRCLKLIEPIYLKSGGQQPLLNVSPGGHEFVLKPALTFFREQLK